MLLCDASVEPIQAEPRWMGTAEGHGVELCAPELMDARATSDSPARRKSLISFLKIHIRVKYREEI